MSTSDIYWITRLDIIHSLLFWVAILTAAGFCTIFTLCGVAHERYKSGFEEKKDTKEDTEFYRSIWITFLVCASIVVLCIIGMVFVPTTKQAVAMYVIPNAMSGKTIGKNTLIQDAWIEWATDIISK